MSLHCHSLIMGQLTLFICFVKEQEYHFLEKLSKQGYKNKNSLEDDLRALLNRERSNKKHSCIAQQKMSHLFATLW